jgi:hypothetical protein
MTRGDERTGAEHGFTLIQPADVVAGLDQGGDTPARRIARASARGSRRRAALLVRVSLLRHKLAGQLATAISRHSAGLETLIATRDGQAASLALLRGWA